jgi:hypothetical protein
MVDLFRSSVLGESADLGLKRPVHLGHEGGREQRGRIHRPDLVSELKCRIQGLKRERKIYSPTRRRKREEEDARTFKFTWGEEEIKSG